MSFILSDNSGNTDFQPAPMGQYASVCVDVIDKGMVETKWGLKHKLGLVFQIDSRMESGNRWTVYANFNASLHENSTLRPFLESWRGRPFNSEELKSFDIEKLIGANAYVQIIHNEHDGKLYANIQTIMPVNANWNMPRLEPENYVRKKDREEQPQQRQTVAAAAPSSAPRNAPLPSYVPPIAPGFDDDDIPF